MPRSCAFRQVRHRASARCAAVRTAAALVRAAGAAVEPLETRRLLSATLDSAGTLLVTGTEGDNEIAVERVDASMRVNEDGRTTSFNAASVRRVEIRALGGHDRASIERAGVPGTLLGGAGEDVLTGGSRNDVLRGEAGDDQLDGGRGADDLSGGDGRDLLRYTTRTARVVVGLGTFADDGEVGERDNARNDIEDVFGGSGNDQLTGDNDRNWLNGGAGNDRLIGNGENDTLEGGEGNDTLLGGAGNDSLDGGRGADDMSGGAGVDRVDYQSHSGVTVRLNSVADDGETGERDNARGDIEDVVGSAGRDRIFGTSAANLLIGGVGDDELFGLGGNDTLHGGDGRDALHGGDGDDVLQANDGFADFLAGGFGTDTADADRRDILNGVERSARSPDIVLFNDGTLRVTGTEADDVIVVFRDAAERMHVQLNDDRRNFAASLVFRVEVRALGGRDEVTIQQADVPGTIFGGAGDDTITGGSADDVISGEGGDDTFTPGGGNDRVFGGDGNDVVVSSTEGDGADDYSGGAGVDMLDYSARTGNLRIGLGTVADDGVIGEGDNARSDFENVVAGNGNDRIFGTNAINFLSGGPGDDELFGRGGNDRIAGGTGRDALHGDDGNDLLQSDDEFADFVAGGFGTDTAEADFRDTLNGVERRA